MIVTRYLPAESLSEFVQELSNLQGDNSRILVPTRQGKAIVFIPYSKDAEFTLDRATSSPKQAVLPACESLFKYKRTKDEEQLDKVEVVLDDSYVPKNTIVFGSRPCDARGFEILDNPYTKGPFTDPYYIARRKALTVISQSCSKLCSTCFCHWVGSGPCDSTGSDILMTAVDGGYVLIAYTEKGEELLKSTSLKQSETKEKEAISIKEKVQNNLPPAPDLKNVQQSLAKLFSDTDFWQKQTAHCLACGACTYLCPTCYCFNITDEGDGLGEEPGQRLRTWDTCMASIFTKEASGHNPRMLKALRMRNRVSHKFSYYPGIWDGKFSCNGCGRCISHCPVNLDIRDIVQAAVAQEKE